MVSTVGAVRPLSSSQTTSGATIGKHTSGLKLYVLKSKYAKVVLHLLMTAARNPIHNAGGSNQPLHCEWRPSSTILYQPYWGYGWSAAHT